MEDKNEYLQKIYKLLEKYEEYYEEKESKLEILKTNHQLYEELLTLLRDEPENIQENSLLISLLLTSIYKDERYLSSFNSLLPNLGKTEENKKVFKSLINKIYQAYKLNEKETILLAEDLQKNRNLCRISKRGKRCIKNDWPISQFKYDIINIKKILIHFEENGVITNKELVLLINEIETYNRRLITKTNTYSSETEKDYTDKKYNEIINIMKAGFIDIPEVEILPDRKPALDKMVREITQYISYQDTLEITKDIEKYRNYNVEDNEYNYILVKLLEHYNEELLGLQELLKDPDVFLRYKDRLEIIKSYYINLDIYLIILKYYDKINEIKETDEFDSETPDDITNENSQPHRRLIYATSPTNIKKARLISDMDDIPKEYYEKIGELLVDFKSRKRDKKIIKYLDDKSGKTNQELKDDQVRIIIKRIKDDIYVVTGAFVKKDNNDRKTYAKFKNRIIPKIDTETQMQIYLELAKQVEIELENKIKEEGRKGTR